MDIENTHAVPKFYALQKDLGGLLGVTGQAICLQAQKAGIGGFKVGKNAAFSPSEVRQLMSLRGFSYPKQTLSFQMLKRMETATRSGFHAHPGRVDVEKFALTVGIPSLSMNFPMGCFAAQFRQGGRRIGNVGLLIAQNPYLTG